MQNAASTTMRPSAGVCIFGSVSVGKPKPFPRLSACFADGHSEEATLIAPRRVDYTNLVPLNGQIRRKVNGSPFPQDGINGQQRPLPEWLAAASNPNIPFSPPEPMPTELLRNKDIDALVLALAKHKSLSSRLPTLMQWLHDSDHAFDARLCTTFISAYQKSGTPLQGVELFHWMIAECRINHALRPTVYTFIAAMRAASEADAFSQVNHIWNLAQELNMSSNERLTSAYMTALFRVNKYGQVLQLFENLRTRSPKVPPQAYVLAMRSLTKTGHPQEALELWHEVQDTTAAPARGKQLYSAAISAYARAKDSKGAASVFSQMLSAGGKPDSFICSALMHAHAGLGEYSIVQRLLEKLPQWKVTPTAHMFSALMTSYVEAKDFGRAVKLWRRMNSSSWKGPPANAHMLSILLCGLGRIVCEQPDAAKLAESLFKDACDGEAGPDLESHARVKGRLDKQEAARVVRTLSLPSVARSQKKGRSLVNPVVCGALMHAKARAGHWQECIAVIGRARSMGIAPSATMFNIAIYGAACARQAYVAEAVFQSVPGQPSRVSRETLLYAYGCCGMHEAAEAIVTSMLADGKPLRDYTAVALIQAYSEAGLWQKALGVVSRLRDLQIRPTVHVLNALLTVCVKHQKYDRGIQILQKFQVRDGPRRTPVTESLVRIVCEEEVSTIDSQQVIATALSAVAAAVGGALINRGLF